MKSVWERREEERNKRRKKNKEGSEHQNDSHQDDLIITDSEAIISKLSSLIVYASDSEHFCAYNSRCLATIRPIYCNVYQSINILMRRQMKIYGAHFFFSAASNHTVIRHHLVQKYFIYQNGPTFWDNTRHEKSGIIYSKWDQIKCYRQFISL